MRLAYFSDRHLEAHPERHLNGADADVLAAVGDIHSIPSEAVKRLHEQAKAKKVLYVLGNHEHSGRSFRTALEEARKAAKGTKVTVLGRGRATIDDVVFLGATLWTGFTLFGPERKNQCMREAQANLRDFKKINGLHGLISPEEIAREHARDVAWIARELSSHAGKRKVLLTHFAPSVRSVSAQHGKDLLSAYYVNPLEHLVKQATLSIHGHVHTSLDYQLSSEHKNQGRVLSNAQGFEYREALESGTIDGNATAWKVVAENTGFQEEAFVDL